MSVEVLRSRALMRREEAIVAVDTWDEFTKVLKGDGAFAHCHWCGEGDCEETIQQNTKVTIRNIPFERDETTGTCVHCGKESIGRVLFAQAY